MVPKRSTAERACHRPSSTRPVKKKRLHENLTVGKREDDLNAYLHDQRCFVRSSLPKLSVHQQRELVEHRQEEGRKIEGGRRNEPAHRTNQSVPTTPQKEKPRAYRKDFRNPRGTDWFKVKSTDGVHRILHGGPGDSKESDDLFMARAPNFDATSTSTFSK